MIETLLTVFFASFGIYRLLGWLQKPSRKYHASHSVSDAYDAWTADGVLEHYWGEHVHLGFYSRELSKWFTSTDGFFKSFVRAVFDSTSSSATFKQTKYTFTDQMIHFGRLESSHLKILDVGCGIGGSTRLLAQRYPHSEILGISISPAQVARAKELTEEAGLRNAEFKVLDAMNMANSLGEGQFDVVYVCESSEHMPDKEAFFSECFQMLKKGGTLVVAAWCCRDGRGRNEDENEKLRFLEEEWSHPKFVSMEEISSILVDMNAREIQVADWTEQTMPSWRHSILVGVWNPWPVIIRPWVWLKTIREIYTIELMHRAFTDGLMQYGMFRAKK